MYKLHHVHFKANDPQKTAQWYIDNLDATLVEEGEGLGGAKVVRLHLGGARLFISSPRPGSALPRGTAQEHLGLEHFGLETDDIEALVKRLQTKGVRVLMPVTPGPSDNRIAFIEAPDDVRIELVQPAR